MRRHILKRLLALTLSGGATLAWPQEPQLIVVRADTSPVYSQAIQSFTHTLEQQGLPGDTIQEVTPSQYRQFRQSGALGAARVVVTFGVAATDAAMELSSNTPVLAGLVPRQSFEQLLQAHGRKTSSRLTALYFDQPLWRQLALLRLTWPQVRQVGVLLGPQSAKRLISLQQSAALSNVTIKGVLVGADSDLFPALRNVMEDSDVLLALADPAVFNGTSLQNILLTSYRARVPMVAFSPAYVRAGATLALFTDPVQAGQQMANLALGAWRGAKLPEAAIEPDDFKIDINQNVARSLGLSLSTDDLRHRLQRLERNR